MKDKRDEKYYRSYLEHNTVSRRGLFRGLLSGANKSLKESSQNTVKPSVPRPPYAVDEGCFLSCVNRAINAALYVLSILSKWLIIAPNLIWITIIAPTVVSVNRCVVQAH